MRRIHVAVNSACAVLMHKFGAAATLELEGKVKKTKTGPPPPRLEAEEAAYRLDPKNSDPVWDDKLPDESYRGKPKGQLALPGEHFFQTLVRTATGFQIKGKGKKTYKDAVKGNVYVEPDYIGLTDPETGKPLHDYEIDSRPVRIQAARIARCRPIIKAWRAEFDVVIVDEDSLPEEVLNAILVKAGQATGVGDYRPRYGRFIVERFEQVRNGA